MPKKNTDITKIQRFDSIRDVLRRHGRLDKKTLDQNVAATLGVNIIDISRNLYRDLNELVDLNEVNVIYYTPDGTRIDEYDSEIHKNTVCNWELKERPCAIPGAHLLKTNLSNIYSNEARFENSITVKTGLKIVKNHINIHFTLFHEKYTITVNKDVLPFNLLIGRESKELVNLDKDNQLLIDSFGKRTIILSLKLESISRFKTLSNETGHCLISFELVDDKVKIFVKDFNSTNKTHYYEIEDFKNFDLEPELLMDGTIDFNFGYENATTVKKMAIQYLKYLDPEKTVDSAIFEPPCILFVGRAISFLIA